MCYYVLWYKKFMRKTEKSFSEVQYFSFKKLSNYSIFKNTN